jgi:hypothetical protein
MFDAFRTIRERHGKGLTNSIDYVAYGLAGFFVGVAGTAFIQWMLGPYALKPWSAFAVFAIIAAPVVGGVTYLGIPTILETISKISKRCLKLCRDEASRCCWGEAKTTEAE